MDFYKNDDKTKSEKNFSILVDKKDVTLHLNQFETHLNEILGHQFDNEQLEQILADIIELLQYKNTEYIEIFNKNSGLSIIENIIQDFPILIEDYIIVIIDLLLEIAEEHTVENFINNQIIIEAIIDNFHISSALHCMLILLTKSIQIPSFILEYLSFDLLFQSFAENRDFIEDYSNEIVPSLRITCILIKNLKLELNDKNLEILQFLLNSIPEIGFDVVCDDEMIHFLESIDFIFKNVPKLIYNISDSFYEGILQLDSKLRYKTYIYSILINLYNQDQSFSRHIYGKLDLLSITSFIFHQNNLGKSNFAFSLAIDILSNYYRLNSNEIGSEFSHELFQHLIEFFIQSQFTNRKILLRIIYQMLSISDSFRIYFTEEFISILIEMLDPSFDQSNIPLKIVLIISENIKLGKSDAISIDFLLESDLVDFLVNKLDPENNEQESIVQHILNNLGIEN